MHLFITIFIIPVHRKWSTLVVACLATARLMNLDCLVCPRKGITIMKVISDNFIASVNNYKGILLKTSRVECFQDLLKQSAKLVMTFAPMWSCSYGSVCWHFDILARLPRDLPVSQWVFWAARIWYFNWESRPRKLAKDLVLASFLEISASFIVEILRSW